jgi:hypothetical protein
LRPCDRQREGWRVRHRAVRDTWPGVADGDGLGQYLDELAELHEREQLGDVADPVLVRGGCEVPPERGRVVGLGGKAEVGEAQGVLDIETATDRGTYNSGSGAPESTAPTSFRQWCGDVLKPAVLAAGS